MSNMSSKNPRSAGRPVTNITLHFNDLSRTAKDVSEVCTNPNIKRKVLSLVQNLKDDLVDTSTNATQTKKIKSCSYYTHNSCSPKYLGQNIGYLRSSIYI